MGKKANRKLIVVGFIFSLSLGFIELAINILFEPSPSIPFFTILPSLLITIALYFFIFIELRELANYLARHFEIEQLTSYLIVALLFGILFIIVHPIGFVIHVLSIRGALNLSIKLIIFFFIIIWIYIAMKLVVYASNNHDKEKIYILASPFILVVSIIFLSLYKLMVKSFFSLQLIWLILGYILSTLFIFGLFSFVIKKNIFNKLCIICIILVILSPGIMFLFNMCKSFSYNHNDNYINTKHQVGHVILIVIDTLRSDKLSCYGSKDVKTPFIDQLAEDGIVFRNAIAPSPWTLPSIASIMTGLSPFIHTATGNTCTLSDSFFTLAEYLKDKGYFTAAIGSNIFLIPKYNLNQGFISYNFFPKLWVYNSFGGYILAALFPNFFPPERSADELTIRTIHWLESNYEKDFFFWIHYYDPHLPYHPPGDFFFPRDQSQPIQASMSLGDKIRKGDITPNPAQKQWLQDLYDGEIRWTDKNIGNLLNALKRLKLYDESLIILTSDHGEEFWEHDRFEHGHSLYNELLKVPLIIKLPFSRVKRKISKRLLIQDIMPTVLDLCEIKYIPETISATSLSPLWADDLNSYLDKPIVSTGLLYGEDRESVFFEKYKYIHTFRTNEEELYDLSYDAEEQHSIAHESPLIVQKAHDILKESHKIFDKCKGYYQIKDKIEIDQDEAIKERLRSLGYLE